MTAVGAESSTLSAGANGRARHSVERHFAAGSRRTPPPDIAAFEGCGCAPGPGDRGARMVGSAGKMSRWSENDYIVVNRDLDPSVAAVKAIVTAERLRRTCRSFGYFVNCPRARPRRLA